MSDKKQEIDSVNFNGEQYLIENLTPSESYHLKNILGLTWFYPMIMWFLLVMLTGNLKPTL